MKIIEQVCYSQYISLMIFLQYRNAGLIDWHFGRELFTYHTSLSEDTKWWHCNRYNSVYLHLFPCTAYALYYGAFVMNAWMSVSDSCRNNPARPSQKEQLLCQWFLYVITINLWHNTCEINKTKQTLIHVIFFFLFNMLHMLCAWSILLFELIWSILI